MRTFIYTILLLAALPGLGSGTDLSSAGGAPAAPIRQALDGNDPPIFRGTVQTLSPGQYRLVACAASGGTSCERVLPVELGVSDLQMIVWATHNTTIQIFGKLESTPGATNCFQDVAAVKVTEDCAEVAAERLVWGAVKAAYR